MLSKASMYLFYFATSLMYIIAATNYMFIGKQHDIFKVHNVNFRLLSALKQTKNSIWFWHLMNWFLLSLAHKLIRPSIVHTIGIVSAVMGMCFINILSHISNQIKFAIIFTFAQAGYILYTWCKVLLGHMRPSYRSTFD